MRCDSTRAMGVEVNYDLEYQGEEARGLASEALNTGFRARARLAEITWHGRCDMRCRGNLGVRSRVEAKCGIG